MASSPIPARRTRRIECERNTRFNHLFKPPTLRMATPFQTRHRL
ncbi:hypothetical protein BN1221_02244 [Brenneria goodwinii]|uniref:Uncharacterized protein n=1 Tax=Brenneria goodwinii TaxID=1109412 RepID=A0A0G4JV40_9GAMM|nr:hypothetical protein BN1221_02244 [Brenneria goodwinii]